MTSAQPVARQFARVDATAPMRLLMGAVKKELEIGIFS